MRRLSLRQLLRPDNLRKMKKIIKKGNGRFRVFLIWLFIAACFNAVLYFLYKDGEAGTYLSEIRKKKFSGEHIQKPAEVKGIYATAYTASSGRFLELVDFVKNNGLNSMVVDIKGPRSEPAFFLEDESLKKYNFNKEMYKPEDIISVLHKNNIYAIARIAVFQDPYLVEREPSLALQWKTGGVWRDWKGVKWLDPTAFGVWRYNVALAREAYGRGFDEIQFDYIRFPSDGNIKAIKYANWSGETKKEEEIEKFFAYVSQVMKKAEIPVSADLFGLVCCNNDDLGIGQSLARALPHFDFISPMMYPSHYSAGFVGKANPAAYPYEVVKYSMEKANEKVAQTAASSTVSLAKLRPWIQDFDIGANYDAVKVLAQIKAVSEEGGEGFLIWNARNVYTALK